MSKSISRIVQELIDKDVSVQHALEKGYGNYSAIARMLKPTVEEILNRKVKLESVITAVKRASTTYKPTYNIDVNHVIAGSIINLRTDIAKISAEKTKRNLETMRRALLELPRDDYIQVIEGMKVITLLLDQKLVERFRSSFPLEGALEEKNNLVAIIITSPTKIIETPGCVTSFYNTISRMHINIEETLSCSTETIMVLHLKDVGKALEALTNLISEARKIVGGNLKNQRANKQSDDKSNFQRWH
ncbi:MAG: hypothetical protein NZ932_04760 [Candidatus Bathyarchaeota archaeon]|nr:hypothetical protein [Candidatus Bathyarchaeota archaeon]MDW8040660.1 hypothetical protein [Nitrososphaerota archaeon]